MSIGYPEPNGTSNKSTIQDLGETKRRAERLQAPEEHEDYFHTVASGFDIKVCPMNSQQYHCLLKTFKEHTCSHANKNGKKNSLSSAHKYVTEARGS